ncbi:MAG: NAD(P)-binding protein [Gammaproteobacteria bacterium]|nr:NAD(P)-binding protein [Gammaproteobacteria bacterium]MYF28446.1 NAD(P)-binding protein [Gammaproteobacteria bacterium]MYK47646.1 NAD(P)-binding protein [Gammaproteobacteria bacterium]
MHVAVIGAGAAGLVTAHELVVEGHRATVFEQSAQVGGLWNYTNAVEDDPLGQRPSRRIHSSLYASMRVNLPRDLMAFEGYTFDGAGGGRDDWPRFPHHARVLEYLRRFAIDTGIGEAVRLGYRVRQVTRDDGWLVDGERFDAVAVCNGHFSEPRVPEIRGLADFPGTALHSHNYRRPDDFLGQRVVVLGSSVSGSDLSRELAGVAEVFFSGRLFDQQPPLGEQAGRIKRCPPIAYFEGADAVLTNTERIRDVDAMLFCTGYWYRFPFLGSDVVSIGDNWVKGLYQQVVAVEDPSLAFIGLPFRVVPFPLFQRQARWFARALACRFPLPSPADRCRMHCDEIDTLRAAGVAERHFHRLEDGQMDYMNRLAAQCGDRKVPDWFVALWREHNANARRHPNDYRDRVLQGGGPTVVA